ncbi:hypothetical protein DQ04_13151010 [Trypanosoma grayi]|uniref:hypothetical protein n=1 Tax=Trypanosoma grayi TaxID=71804 RepID=UPI0004F49C9A|nr:hypothetical protein DQ04_13151010 [Trypanosoma grayi]KEG06595.1 hypothetical protein DQ04_13151010 [Trypanosoma grayi]
MNSPTLPPTVFTSFCISSVGSKLRSDDAASRHMVLSVQCRLPPLQRIASAKHCEAVTSSPKTGMEPTPRLPSATPTARHVLPLFPFDNSSARWYI